MTSQQSEVPGHAGKCTFHFLAVSTETNTSLRAVVTALGSTAALLPPVGHNTVMKALPCIRASCTNLCSLLGAHGCTLCTMLLTTREGSGTQQHFGFHLV